MCWSGIFSKESLVYRLIRACFTEEAMAKIPISIAPSVAGCCETVRSQQTCQRRILSLHCGHAIQPALVVMLAQAEGEFIKVVSFLSRKYLNFNEAGSSSIEPSMIKS